MIKNFKKIGEYRKPNSNPEYKEFIGFNKMKIIPIVYIFVVEKEIKYIGETRRGYSRPLSFNKNKIMLAQKNEINKITSFGKKVEVFAYEVKSIDVFINDMKVKCYLAQDYEKALIKQYNPKWNKRT